MFRVVIVFTSIESIFPRVCGFFYFHILNVDPQWDFWESTLCEIAVDIFIQTLLICLCLNAFSEIVMYLQV